MANHSGVGRLLAGVAATVACVAMGSGAWGFEIKGLPGATWGQAFHESADLSGPGVMGFVNQGVDWVTLPGDVTVNSFVELRYRFREHNKQYFNSYGPALGVELRRAPFHLGVNYYWERYPDAPQMSQSSNRLQFYLSWYYDWDLKRP